MVNAPGQKAHTALVTGALGGIGQAIARRLAADGLRLVLTDVRRCDELAASDDLADSVIHHGVCDLASPDDVEAFTAEVLAQTGVDVLINNAAFMTPVPFAELTVETFRRYQRINVEAPFQLCKAFVPGMSQRGWGRIVNLVSGSAWQPPPAFAGYVTSKMGLVGLTRSLAVELGSAGITVNAITPSLTRHPGIANDLPEEMWAAVQKRQAIKRPATPEDLVGAISFLVSDDSAFMTGQTVSVDGGMLFL